MIAADSPKSIAIAAILNLGKSKASSKRPTGKRMVSRFNADETWLRRF
jgi:hypothetical protein